MSTPQFYKLLACPICKKSLSFHDKYCFCRYCKVKYKKMYGIWNFFVNSSSKTQKSKNEYDEIFTNDFGGPQDGSYEILANISRGNKTVDIACGTGLIEKMSPETVGVDFSINALREAKKNGAKHLILADAHELPFKDNSFDISISSGNLEHFLDPQTAVNEMARVSKIQVIIAHRYPPIPLASTVHKLITKTFNIKHQPIEKPIGSRQLIKMLASANLNIIFKGVWTLPVNYGKVLRWLPEFKNIPSCWFTITIKHKI